MKHVLHIATGLGVGGAEFSLLRVISSSDPGKWKHTVISLAPGGALAGALRDVGAEVIELDLEPNTKALISLPGLALRIRRAAPDVVQTWMYHADLMGGLAARLAGVRALAWGIHHSSLDPDYNKASTLRVVKACRAISGLVPARIVCCSAATLRVHAEFGYSASKLTVITNGYETDSWVPDSFARTEIREELGIGPEISVVGMVGRFHPLKDFQTFVHAAAELKTAMEQVCFVLCGEGVDAGNVELTDLIRKAGLEDAIHLLGRREDVAHVMNSFDVASLSSRGEGFPNVVCEAMACGKPCAVTDVGDSAEIVGDTGLVVPPGDPSKLAEAWRVLLSESNEAKKVRGLRARERIISRYSLARVSAQYHELWRDLADRDG